jgi:hypothetical protein
MSLVIYSTIAAIYALDLLIFGREDNSKEPRSPRRKLYKSGAG